MVSLGLARITALLKQTPQTWKAIHVAGTNGKGSICAYLMAMLRANQISCGRFTSPHLIHPRDCITINDSVVSESKFKHFEELVKRRNEEQCLGASEFELLTATAFEIFESEKVEFGIIEVGLGGRLDATNVLKHKCVTVISKIGIDHQSFLGNTIEEISLQKAGIMRHGVPCVADGSNPASVSDVLTKHAEETGTRVQFTDPESDTLVKKLSDNLAPHQRQNLACAHEAFRLAYPQHASSTDVLASAARNMVWPGRLQLLSIEKLTGRKQNVLLDGAHNPQSAEVLSAFVERHLRSQGKPITWVLAATQGKDVSEMFKLLLRDGDSIVTVEFGPVDQMPWVRPTNSAALLDAASKCGVTISSEFNSSTDVLSALKWASQTANEGPLAIAGSLYLVYIMASELPRNLIVVCCHGIWLGGPSLGHNEDEWLIAEFQKGETPTFIEHIKAGLRVLKEDKNAVLIFSGGPTRKENRLSEAQSYANLASANAYFGILSEAEAAGRISCEERALDSYYNVLFSLIEFWKCHGTWPRKLTLVSHAFKRERLVDCHCGAIDFPLDRVDFVGVDPPGMIDGSNLAAIKGITEAITQWKDDPHGKDELLASKRRKRNPWGISQMLFADEDNRTRSGVQSRLVGEDEYLIEGVFQPWSH
ncbi:FolC bifunctional protein [Annulohypoxylon maeteangense]|uniref:FolC bifunctional protein n=1 Tax=Annulohypoxylon maeteangense TaxID=1927788 RepID=UPI0020079B02|nr:FolC bifunctional protein [Annulohypoxylon maeteangense]KAI0885893.1 FolC bifunctional protein [Annulohypoxylon maeteangense]